MGKKKNKTWDPLKAQKAAVRKAFFEAGGTLAEWRGRAVTFSDKAKKQDKDACRGESARNAIKDSDL